MPIPVHISINYFPRFDSNKHFKRLWIGVHALVRQEDFESYYGGQNATPDGAPALDGSQCEFLLAAQTPACGTPDERFLLVNLPSNVDFGVELGRKRLLSDEIEWQQPSIWIPRTTRLRFADKPNIQRLYGTHNGGLVDDPEGGNRALAPNERQIEPRPFAELYSRQVHRALRRASTSAEEIVTTRRLLHATLGQGNLILIDPNWFSEDTDEHLLKIDWKYGLPENFEATCLHSLLGLTLGLPEDLDDARNLKFQFRVGGEQGKIVPLPLDDARTNMLAAHCERLFPSLDDADQPEIQVSIDQELRRRVYCLPTLTSFPIFGSASAGVTHFRRSDLPQRDADPKQSEAARVLRRLRLFSTQASASIATQLNDAETIEATLIRSLAGVLRRYRSSPRPATASGEMLFEFVPAAEDKKEIETLAQAGAFKGNAVKVEIHDTDGSEIAAQLLGAWKLPWDQSRGDERQTILFTRRVDKDEPLTRPVLLWIGAGQTCILTGDGPAIDGIKSWSFVPAQNDPTLRDRFDMVRLNSTLFKNADKAVFEQPMDLSSLSVNAEFSDKVVFQFAQSAEAIEQVVKAQHTTVEGFAAPPSAAVEVAVDDLANYSGLLVSTLDAKGNWALANAHEHYMPVNPPVCDKQFEYVFHFRRNYSLEPVLDGDRKSPASFYDDLFQGLTLSKEGQREIGLSLQHTYGEVREFNNVINEGHLPFPVAHIAEVMLPPPPPAPKGQAKAAQPQIPPPFVWTELKSSTDTDDRSDRLLLHFNLQCLLKPEKDEPSPTQAIATTDEVSQRLRAQWSAYRAAWKSIAELSQAKQVTVVARLGEFEFRNLRGIGAGAAAFGEGVRPIQHLKTPGQSAGIFEWPVPTTRPFIGEGRNLLSEFAATLLKYAREHDSFTFQQLNGLRRQTFGGDFLEVPLPLEKADSNDRVILGSAVTVALFNLRIVRNARRQPPQLSWQRVRPEPPPEEYRNSEQNHFDGNGLKVRDLEPASAGSIHAQFDAWRESLQERSVPMTPARSDANEELLRSLFGRMPALTLMGQTATGKCTIPEAQRAFPSTQFTAEFIQLSTVPIAANAYLGQRVQQSMLRYMTALDDWINCNFDASTTSVTWIEHFDWLQAAAPSIKALISKAAALYRPAPSDAAGTNPDMPTAIRSTLSQLKGAAPTSLAGPMRARIEEMLLQTPGVLAQAKALLLIQLAAQDNGASTSIPGDLVRMEVSKVIRPEKSPANGADDRDQFMLFDGIGGNADPAQLGFIDVLPDDQYDSSMEIGEVSLSTFEDLIAENFTELTATVKGKNRTARAPGGKILPQRFAARGSTRPIVDLPARWRVLDPILLDADFLPDEPGDLKTLNLRLTSTDSFFVPRVSLKTLVQSPLTAGSDWKLRLISKPGDGNLAAVTPREFADMTLFGVVALLTGSEEAEGVDWLEAIDDDTLIVGLRDPQTEERPEKITAEPTKEVDTKFTDAVFALPSHQRLLDHREALLRPASLEFAASTLEPYQAGSAALMNSITLSFRSLKADGKISVKLAQDATSFICHPSAHVFHAAPRDQSAAPMRSQFVVMVLGWVPIWQQLEIGLQQTRNVADPLRTVYDPAFENASNLVKSASLLSAAVVRHIDAA